MVRKTTAVDVTNTKNTETKQQTSTEENGFDFEKLMSDARKGAQENGHLLLGVIFLLLGLIQLRAFLLGMILITAGILFVSGFFKNKK